VAIFPVKDQLARNFYAEMCRLEGWSVRTLRAKIDGMLYERTAIAKKPKQVIEHEIKSLRKKDKLTPILCSGIHIFWIFLDLAGNYYQEKNLKSAILRELEKFLIELGAGFCFVARQKRIIIDNEDFYIDLLFYHRKLKRLVAIDLKLGKFKAAYKGQMELYLRWLKKYETESGEKSPLGLMLCAEGNREQIELLQLDRSGIHVAEYLTELPSKALLRKKLHSAVWSRLNSLYLREQQKKLLTKMDRTAQIISNRLSLM